MLPVFTDVTLPVALGAGLGSSGLLVAAGVAGLARWLRLLSRAGHCRTTGVGYFLVASAITGYLLATTGAVLGWPAVLAWTAAALVCARREKRRPTRRVACRRVRRRRAA